MSIKAKKKDANNLTIFKKIKIYLLKSSLKNFRVNFLLLVAFTLFIFLLFMRVAVCHVDLIDPSGVEIVSQEYWENSKESDIETIMNEIEEIVDALPATEEEIEDARILSYNE